VRGQVHLSVAEPGATARAISVLVILPALASACCGELLNPSMPNEVKLVS